MRISLSPVKLLNKIKHRSLERKKRNCIHRYNFRGFKRYYHYHCRKTAGTSIAKMFLSVDGRNGNELFRQLGQHSDQSMLVEDKVFVGWDKDLIEQGDYFFGFSHIPMDDINIPDGTFRFTSFRDPIERVVSHYRMLLDFSKQEIPHPCFAREGKWLGASFDDFLDLLPAEHLKNQLYMFSTEFCLNQAVERIAELDFCFFVESLDDGLRAFESTTGIALNNRRDRVSRHEFQLQQSHRERLQQMLADEYELLRQARRMWLESNSSSDTA